jgi:tight adherence protein C
MVLLLFLGLVLVLVALFLVGQALRPSGDGTGVTRSLAVLQAMSTAPPELRRQVDRPFSDRIVAPLRARTLRLGRRLGGRDSAERYRHRLDLAGNPAGWSVDGIVSAKVVGAAAGTVAGLGLGLLMTDATSLRVLAVLAGLVLGFLAVDLLLYQRAYDRSEQVQRALPDAIDLLTISVESGLGFDAAILQVARNTDGPLADELARVLQEMQLGQGRAAALRGLAERTNVADLRTFVSAMVQADQFGIPVGQVLRVQSQEIRVKRRQLAETRAQQVPVKITVPLIFFILPSLFVAVLGPAALTMMDNL